MAGEGDEAAPAEDGTNPASSSPCFDISEFLGTPRKDGSNSNCTDEVFSNLSGLNLSPSSFTMLPLADSEGHDADFSALLLYHHHHHHHHHQECKDSSMSTASFFDDDQEHLVNNSASASASAVPCYEGGHRSAAASSLFPPSAPASNNMFGQHGSFLAGGEGGGGGGGGIAEDLEGSLDNTTTTTTTTTTAATATASSPAPVVAAFTPPNANAGGGGEWGLSCEGSAAAAAAHHHHRHHHLLHNHSHHHQHASAVQPASLQCDSCQILRCIIHSNGILAAQSSHTMLHYCSVSNKRFWAPGVQDTKLEIHGCDNISYHAVLHTRFCIDDGFPTALEQQMVEFPVGNAEYVRQFLLQYSLLRRKEGFVLRHDSLSTGVDQGPGYSFVPERGFNTTGAFLSKQIGSDFSNNGGAYGKSGQAKLLQTGASDGNEQGEPSAAPAKPPKSNAAAQRERTGKLKMSDLAQHFHLPINAAAKELGICPTVLKKICRRNGMRRWPHRKIKSIERIIATLEQTIAEGAGQGDEGIRMEIAMLRNERAQLCAGLLGQN